MPLEGVRSTIFPIKKYGARTNFAIGQPGIIGPSILIDSLIMPGGCLIESMHLIYEGICKTFNYFFFKKKKLPCYLSIIIF